MYNFTITSEQEGVHLFLAPATPEDLHNSPRFYRSDFLQFLDRYGIRVVRSSVRFAAPEINPAPLYRILNPTDRPAVGHAIELFTDFLEADAFIDQFDSHDQRRNVEAQAEQDPHYGILFRKFISQNPYNANQLTAVSQFVALLSRIVQRSELMEDPLKSNLHAFLTMTAHDLRTQVLGTPETLAKIRAIDPDLTAYDGYSMGQKTAVIDYFKWSLLKIHSFLQMHGVLPAQAPDFIKAADFAEGFALDMRNPSVTHLPEISK